ncbi:MAG: hypothetical protein EOM40_08285 [Clostridia bacterium]|nr:hypothetical protein [Clostridia bacterium]
MGIWGVLFRFELKKLMKRKLFWIIFVVLGVFVTILASSYFFGAVYVEGEVYETHAQSQMIERENGKKLSGKKIDDELIGKMQDAMVLQEEIQEATEDSTEGSNIAYLFTDEYQKIIRPMHQITWFVRSITSGSDLDPVTITAEELYEKRSQTVEAQWDNYRLSESEKEYWSEKEEQVKTPFTFQYAQSFNDLISISGVYLISMVVTFFIAVCLSGIFTDEHGRKMDQLILCSKLGRKQVFYAKMAAGAVVSFVVTLIYMGIVMGIEFLMYGTTGFDAVLQLSMPYSSITLSVGQIFLITLGILLLSNIMITCFTMMLAEVLRSNIGSMAVVIAIIFLAVLCSIPYEMRTISQMWNYIPLNLLKLDLGITDCRLISIFGLQLTSLQFAPILYSLLTVVFVLIGKKAYCNYQVSGR